MIAVPEKRQDVPIEELIKFLLRPRRPRIRVQLRPYCDEHGGLMRARKKVNGFTHYYCPVDGCQCSWKVKARIV